MNYYSTYIKSGKNKNRIIAEGFADSQAEFIKRYQKDLTDYGVYLELDGIVYKKNFVVKLISRG